MVRMVRWAWVALVLVSGLAEAGQMVGAAYVGERFGRIEIVLPQDQWRVTDREATGTVDDGGPVVDLQLQQAIDGSYPVVRVSAVRKVDASVTADLVLQTSREALEKQGGTVGPLLTSLAGGKIVRAYETDIAIQGKPAKVIYILLDGRQAIFSLQVAVPAASVDRVRTQVDALIAGIRY